MHSRSATACDATDDSLGDLDALRAIFGEPSKQRDFADRAHALKQ